jgi:hypothetical protein
MPFTLEAAMRYTSRPKLPKDEMSTLEAIEREALQLDDESFAPFRERFMLDERVLGPSRARNRTPRRPTRLQ